MKSTILAAILLTIGGATAAEGPAPDPRVVTAHSALGFDLLHELDSKPGENVFFSPSSISTALEMTYNGASGRTKAEMAKSLHLDGRSLDTVNHANQSLRTSAMSGDPKVKVAIANSLWAQKGFPFLATFMQPVRRLYAAAVENVDFGVPTVNQRINAWVEQRTNGKIRNLLPRLNPLTRLVLVNAVYFHGQWTDQFKKAATHQQPFHPSTSSAKQVQMMSRSGQYRYLKGDGFQAIRLPYGSGRFAMYVFLPDTMDGLRALSRQANAARLSEWLKGMRPMEGSISLPRFKVEYSQALNTSLKSLGMRQAFDRSAADFRGMTGRRDLYIGLVQHKAFVDVNEEGTEAAAATAVVMVGRAAPGPHGFVMVVDHPFLCAIRDDQTGEILFLGTIYDPTTN
ncbi:MAG TPA: serpin family protein [Armatimonadota bacterium]|jgi:serpin B